MRADTLAWVIAEDGSDDQALPVDAQTDEGTRRLREWQDELSASPGWRALGLMSYVRRVGYVFQANVAQLNTLAAQVQDAAVSAQFCGRPTAAPTGDRS